MVFQASEVIAGHESFKRLLAARHKIISCRTQLTYPAVEQTDLFDSLL